MKKEIIAGVIGILIGFVVGFFAASARQPKNAATAAAPQVGQPSNAGAPSPAGAVPEGHPPQEVINQVLEMKKTAEREPNNVEVRAQLANTYFDIGRYADSIDYYTQALALDPNNINYRTDRATAYHYLGQTEPAMADLKRSLEIDPTHPPTLFNLGVVRLHGLNDPKGAVEAWEQFVRLNPKSPATPKVQEQIDKLKKQLASDATKGRKSS